MVEVHSDGGCTLYIHILGAIAIVNRMETDKVIRMFL